MDTNRGEFVGPDRAEQWMKRLAVGQNVKVLGEEFEVLEIGKRTLLLKLLSYEDRALGRSSEAPEDAEAIESARHRDRMLAGKG